MSSAIGTVFYVKHGDTEPSLQATLLGGDGQPINLTGVGVTVKLTMTRRAAGVTTPKISLATCTIDGDPTQGNVSYAWQAADVDTAGTYDLEFKVTLLGGRVQRVPGYGFDTVVVSERLA